MPLLKRSAWVLWRSTRLQVLEDTLADGAQLAAHRVQPLKHRQQACGVEQLEIPAL